jgi:hypothetical protein
MGLIVPHDPTSSAAEHLPAAHLLEHVIPPSVLEGIVRRYRQPHWRDRKLPGALVVLLVIAMSLYPGTELSVLLTLLLLPQILMDDTIDPATRSSISRARARWGPRPLAALMRQVCQPLGTPDTPGTRLCGYPTVALDASYEDLPDTPANVRVFGRRHGSKGASAFPQLLGTYLVECGTHAILDACPWPCTTSEHRAAPRLLRSITPGMLVLWDRGLHSYRLATAVRQHDAHFLGRVPAQQTFVPLSCLPDNSQLALWVSDAPSHRATDAATLTVRIVT